MLKKLMLFVISGLLTMNLCGCFALFAGVAGGAGTAVWLSGKLTQEFHATYPATIDAVKLAMQDLNLPIQKETQDENTTQIRGTYTDGKDIWIDIHHESEHSTKVEIRIGSVNPDKDADSLILKKIQEHL